MTGGARAQTQGRQTGARAGDKDRRTEGDDDEAEEEVRKPEFELRTNLHERLNGRAQRPRTWLSPCTLVTMAAPRPVVTLTLMPPIMLQTMMYQSMLLVPYVHPPRQLARAK